ncbi:MAG TPA: hypothetical protein VG456_28975 [Candidatus Sulfopaludibacter sp.]|nr:hypothetical protein [Candidatus Sulfopaludibacter sp.]
MPSLDLSDAHSLLLAVVSQLYSARHSPIPGALVKASLVSAASANGFTFNERDLGCKNFLDFVRGTPGVAVQIRIGSDMLLAPDSAEEMLSAFARPLPRLRRDFWRAFIEFEVPETIRLYDVSEDKIYYESLPTSRKGILIDPVSRELQLKWRASFAEEQPDNVKGDLLASLNGNGTAIFNEFARQLRKNPSVLYAWNRYLQKQITDHVAKWAEENHVSEERWRGASLNGLAEASPDTGRPQSISQRAELYNFFDSLPLEDLLQLRVPLEWVLKVTRERK